jgi:hypothetical protein
LSGPTGAQKCIEFTRVDFIFTTVLRRFLLVH